jgi:DNA mismatch repair protein MutS2
MLINPARFVAFQGLKSTLSGGQSMQIAHFPSANHLAGDTESWNREALLADALERLEWGRLTDVLADLAALSHTKLRLKSVSPWITRDEREWNLKATERLLRLHQAGEDINLLPFNANHFAEALQHGALLNGLGLYHLGLFCSQIERLGNKARNDARRGAESTLGVELATLLSQLKPQASLARRLALSADENGRILDSASTELKEARAKYDALTRKMTQALENTLKVPTIRDALQDTVWMIRDGRYVLPVRVDRKSDVPGVPRGVSSTGNTIFLEPAGLSELQSQLSSAEADVMIAENRVLRAFSDEAYGLRQDLLSALDILETFDDVAARARLAAQLQGVAPQFHNEPEGARFEILDARHPLFVLEDKNCVPNHLLLTPQPDQKGCPRVWVLSGPNAGGKTVAMKTVGLLCAMALAGLFVPAQTARLFEFNSIFVEMGDRQDRREDLSTFSGHLMHVKRICELADAQLLVLLDEGFVGTDPSIGSAMAQATLETLAARGTTAIITTHFSSLKSLADKQPLVFANASMEFEPEQLKPTFHLLNGVPGQSFAIELARRLSYPEELLQRAMRYRGEREIELENMLAELQRTRHQLRASLETNQKLNTELESEVTQLSAQRKALAGAQEALMAEFTAKMQKRFNAFENRLETRARQFERAQQQILQEQRERALTEAPPTAEGALMEQAAVRKPTPTHAPQPKPLSKEEIQAIAAVEKKKSRSLSDFSQLASIKMNLPTRKTDWEEAEDEIAHQQARRPANLTQRDLMDEARESLEVMRKAFDRTSEQFANRRTEISGDLRDTSEKAKEILSEARDKKAGAVNRPASYWSAGMRCKTASFDQVGEVLRQADNKGMVECRFGLLKTKLHHSALMTVEQAAQTPKTQQKRAPSTAAVADKRHRNTLDMSLDPVLPTRDNTIDVRGHLVDTALEHVERFLDKSWRNDQHTVVIVHGHGTGRIKTALREYLQNCSYALRFRPGTSGEGGDGATIVVFE